MVANSAVGPGLGLGLGLSGLSGLPLFFSFLSLFFCCLVKNLSLALNCPLTRKKKIKIKEKAKLQKKNCPASIGLKTHFSRRSAHPPSENPARLLHHSHTATAAPWKPIEASGALPPPRSSRYRPGRIPSHHFTSPQDRPACVPSSPDQLCSPCLLPLSAPPLAGPARHRCPVSPCTQPDRRRPIDR